MSDVVLGELIFEECERDAVHVAVYPVIASEKLYPGQDIGLVEAASRTVGKVSRPIGIVDPFLGHFVSKGDQFWMFLYPQTVTGMRHHWTHPMIGVDAAVPAKKDPPTKEESEAWLRDYISKADCPSFEVTIAAALGEPLGDAGDWCSYRIEDFGDGDYLFFSGSDAHGDIPEEFWDHVENMTGRVCPCRAKGFSCSC